MENIPKLGKLIEGDAPRDAIHIAVAPVVAGEWLEPGAHVGFAQGHTRVTADAPHIGIIDPFLKEAIGRGDKCWLFLYQGSITSLRHEWAHPAFPAPVTPQPSAEAKSDAEKVLRAFAEELGRSYPALLEAMEDWVENDEHWRGGGEFEGVGMPRGLWDHYVTVTGKKRPTADQGEYFFSCSC